MTRLPPFQAFLDDNAERVWRFLVGCVGPVEAEDCFQETFLAALRAYPELRRAGNLTGWVMRIAHSKAMDSHRGRARRPRAVAEVPERAAHLGAETDDALWGLVRALPDKQCAAIAHRFANDMSYREIARVMSCSEDAARRSVHEGIKRLREAMGA
jgi:RNA polymerase sigma factor (sigma-70 family)